jgi:hypothetical protein
MSKSPVLLELDFPSHRYSEVGSCCNPSAWASFENPYADKPKMHTPSRRRILCINFSTGVMVVGRASLRMPQLYGLYITHLKKGHSRHRHEHILVQHFREHHYLHSCTSDPLPQVAQPPFCLAALLFPVVVS